MSISGLRNFEHFYDEPHLCRSVASAAGIHAGGKQPFFESGGGVYPFVEAVYGALLLDVGEV